MGTETATIEVTITGSSGQNKRHAKIPPGVRASELVDRLLPSMGLPRHDLDSRPLVYRLRNNRTGQQLAGGDVVTESVRESDTLEIMNDITPG